MKIIVKNKFVSWGGSSKVEDEAGNALYRVKGIAFSWTRRKRLLDLNGNVLYKIRNKCPTFLLHSAYIIDRNGNKLCKVKQNLKINELYKIEGSDDSFRILGNPLQGMQVQRNGQYIGAIKKEVWKLRDYFVLDVPDGQEPAFLIALTIAIDNVQDKSKGTTN